MDQPWVVVLAGGEGTRIRSMTSAPDGTPVPKQFCRLRDGTSLFHRAVARGLAVTRGARIVPVVQRHHRVWWERDLRGLRHEILIAQRDARGTAHAVYRAVEEVARRDPSGIVLVVPSDHVADDEARFRSSLGRLCREARANPDHLILLGIPPEEPDPEYGWIVPGDAVGRGLRRVCAFLEKPTRDQAAALVGRGALVNALIVAATAGPLLALYERCLPDLVAGHRSGERARARASWDLSRDLLGRTTRWQRVLPVPSLGWCDLGTPERLRQWMVRHEEFFWWGDEAATPRNRARSAAQPIVSSPLQLGSKSGAEPDEAAGIAEASGLPKT